MEKHTFYAVFKKHGSEIDRSTLGKHVLTDETVPAGIYDKMIRMSRKAYPAMLQRGEHIEIVTEDGRHPAFTGYPATGFLVSVRFEKNHEN